MTPRSAPLLIIFAALVLGAARCPPTGPEPEPTPEPAPGPEEEDAGIIDDAGPQPEPEVIDAGEPDVGPDGEPCVPDPGGVPTEAESLAYFTDTGIPDHFTSCASCHFDGTPTVEGTNWGAGGDQTPNGWHIAAVGSYDNDVTENPSVTPQGTDLYRTTSAVHFGNQPNQGIVDDIVAWITYRTTAEPPVVCNEPDPEPTPEPPIDAGPIDAGPIDAGQPEPDPEPDGVPGEPYAIEFVTSPYTIPRDTCVPFVTTIRLVDVNGVEVDATEEIRVALTGSPNGMTFWDDSGCINSLTDDVDFAVGESQKSFRWKSSVAGEVTITARPNPSSGVLLETQTQTVSN